jgi:hypothetical protein
VQCQIEWLILWQRVAADFTQAHLGRVPRRAQHRRQDIIDAALRTEKKQRYIEVAYPPAGSGRSN